MVKVLTKNEEKVIEYHNAGKNFREIADILMINHHSVKALLISAQQKLSHND